MNRVLVKMPNWVGDCIMATPALGLMKAAVPGIQIDLLVRPSVAGILEDNPHKSSIIAANDKDMSPEVLSRLKGANYDAVALMTNSLRSAWLGRRLGIPKRIGFNREGRGLLLTHKLRFRPRDWQSPTPKPLSRRSIKGAPSDQPPRHMVEYYLEIARATVAALGAAPLSNGMDYTLNLPLHRPAEEKVARLLREHQIQGKTLIGVNPGAAHGPAKRWPPEFLGHALEILSRPDWVFVSTAAPNESHLNDAVEAAAGFSIVRLGEQVTLRELPALISRFALLISNDSGPMHIAAARGVPTVAIFGPTDPPGTQPWQAPHTLARNYVECSPCFLEECPIDHRCMRGLSPFTIAEEVLNILSNSNRWAPFAR